MVYKSADYRQQDGKLSEKIFVDIPVTNIFDTFQLDGNNTPLKDTDRSVRYNMPPFPFVICLQYLPRNTTPSSNPAY
jgi:hypothetical protein